MPTIVVVQVHSLWVADVCDARRLHAEVDDLGKDELVVRQVLFVQLVDADAARALCGEQHNNNTFSYFHVAASHERNNMKSAPYSMVTHQ